MPSISPPPPFKPHQMGPAARPSYIRRSVQFSDIIIYENWTTDGMGRESRTLPPVTKVSMAVPSLSVQRGALVRTPFPPMGTSPQQESMLKEIAECTGLSLAQVKKLQASMA